jgi:ribose/xylose/arabinose/galactoside ABC-type transport system permease subunit
VLANSDRIGVFRGGRLVATYDAQDATAEMIAVAALPSATDSPKDRKDEKDQKDASTASFWSFSSLRSFWSTPRRVGSHLARELGLLAVVLLLTAGLALGTDNFWKEGTLRDVGENAGLLVLCGLGASLVILAGGIDISFGSIMALGAAVCGTLMEKHDWPPVVAVLAGLGVAAAAGSCNAVLTLVGRVHPIVITLGTRSAYRGLTMLLIGRDEIKDVPDAFQDTFHAAPFGVPLSLWLAMGAVGLAWFLLGWTIGGRQTLALGSNPVAAERTGIHRWRVWLAVFTLQGLLAGVAGILALAMTRRLQATDFDEMTLEAISVAVVGGIAITGGRGSVWGIWAAALLFRVLEKGWFLLHISSYWQRTIVGLLLLMAILADRAWRRRGEL